MNLNLNQMIFQHIPLFHHFFSDDKPEERNKQKQEYILSKIQNFTEAKKAMHQELITGLPAWENEYENIRNSRIN
mgnify:CR=1 FL=1